MANKSITVLNKLQRLVERADIQIHYHNHSEEFTMMNEEKCLMDYFMEETNPDIKLQLDTGWVMYGGGDVLKFMEKYKERLISVHLKDFIQGFQYVEREEAFAAVGYGVLPIAEILKMSSKIKLIKHGLMIDQDRASKGAILAEDLRKGADCVKQLLKNNR